MANSPDSPNRDAVVTPRVGRAPNALRDVRLDRGVAEYAEGSCLVEFGKTRVLCTASVDEDVPRWMRGSGKGWVTAEYSMLPGASPERIDREAAKGKQSGRTVEIQRLIGRSLHPALVHFPNAHIQRQGGNADYGNGEQRRHERGGAARIRPQGDRSPLARRQH